MNTGKLPILTRDPVDVCALIERCRHQDREAFNDFYRLYRDEVTRNLFHILGPGRSALEDVLQDVFIEVFRSLARFRGDAKLSTWLYRVCINVAMQRIRKRKRLAEISNDELAEKSTEETPESTLSARRRIAVIYSILDKLSSKKRVVFVLHEIEERDSKEIASMLGVPVLTVRTRLHYARKDFYALAATTEVGT
jgi:RNA polymerase sigma-70 factor (ECF subfamily)